MTLSLVKVCGWSLLATWKGTNESLLPVLLVSHIDVVPVDTGMESNWKHPPFGGVVDDG